MEQWCSLRTLDPQSTAVQPSYISMPTESRVIEEVSAGTRHTCAVDSARQVLCWGTWRLDHHDPRQPWLSCRQFQRSLHVTLLGSGSEVQETPGIRSISAGGDVTWNPDTGLATVCWGKGNERRGAPWGVRRSHWVPTPTRAAPATGTSRSQSGNNMPAPSSSHPCTAGVGRTPASFLGTGAPNLLTPESGRGPDRIRHPHGGRRRDRRQLRRSQAISL